MKNKLFNIYFYLFFFIMINREFVPFGIELRIIEFLIGFILMFFFIIDKNKNIKFFKRDFFLIGFFVVSIFSNVMWHFNGLKINNDAFKVIFVSCLFNFLSYLVFKCYENNIELKKFYKAMMVSTIVLFISIMLVYFKIDIMTYLMSKCKGYVLDLSPNFLGGTYRYGGYAEDPNYASLFFIFAIATHIYFCKKEKKKINILFLLMFSLGFLLSASKTILVAILPSLIITFLAKLKVIKFIKKFWVPFIIFMPIFFIISDLKLFQNIITLTQRFSMWKYAIELFKHSPIIGNGLTAFRSYAAEIGWWYVQCHSTIFQMLSETGIISLTLFGLILSNSLKSEDKYLNFMTLLFSVFMITTETAYHIYFIFILGVLPIIIERMQENEKS